MKKYRSLWCMSTTNHNILYFAVIPCTLFLNTGICLWKAQNSLARRGLRRDFASRAVQIGRPPWVVFTQAYPPALSVLIPKPSPAGGCLQDAKQVQFALATVGVVDNSAHSLDDLHGRRGSWVPGWQRRPLPIGPRSATEATSGVPRPQHANSPTRYRSKSGANSLPVFERSLRQPVG